MSICPLCYRDNEPVGGRCPNCGALRQDASRRQAEEDDEPTNNARPSRGNAPSAAALERPRGVTSVSLGGAEEKTPPRATMPQPGALVAPRLILKGMTGDVTEYSLGENNVLGRSTTASVRLP